ncbi:FAD-binding oxidoreductase [Sphingobacterium sp. SGR-19]|uniref:FAD-binding oxidoreductase n=1 Tax=Sphingobacterium sp. SGR-19 TaxID=2710886 RepID=UPI00397E195B
MYLSPSVKQIQLKGDFKNLAFPVGAFFDVRVSDTDARRYSVAQINEEKDNLELIVHLHGKGCGSDYSWNKRNTPYENQYRKPNNHKGILWWKPCVISSDTI